MTEEQQKPVGAVQSTRPEDTRVAREANLDAEDFEDVISEDDWECLDAATIREIDDSRLVKVPCPEWPTKNGKVGFVFVRNPSGTERNKFEQERTVRRKGNREMNLRDLKERLVVWFACDKDRKPIFDRDAVKWLRDKNSAPINRIADKALQLGGWTDQDVEDMVKNSKGGPNSSDT